jgi:hypothetical protein
VNGGTDLYKDAFFTPQFLVSNPDKKPMVETVKAEIFRQILALDQGLAVHKRRAGNEMADMQQLLEGKN